MDKIKECIREFLENPEIEEDDKKKQLQELVKLLKSTCMILGNNLFTISKKLKKS